MEQVTTTWGQGKHTSLALDEQGNPHISYYSYSQAHGALKYAKGTVGCATSLDLSK